MSIRQRISVVVTSTFPEVSHGVPRARRARYLRASGKSRDRIRLEMRDTSSLAGYAWRPESTDRRMPPAPEGRRRRLAARAAEHGWGSYGGSWNRRAGPEPAPALRRRSGTGRWVDTQRPAREDEPPVAPGSKGPARVPIRADRKWDESACPWPTGGARGRRATPPAENGHPKGGKAPGTVTPAAQAR